MARRRLLTTYYWSLVPAGGSLKDLITKNGETLPDYDVMRYTHMILETLRYVHGKGYAHCDIKHSNILVFPSRETETDHSPQDYYIKIANFGSIKRRDNLLSRRCRGTLLYSSLESILCGLHESPANIWSLGCTMIEMITGKPPWSTIKDVWQLQREIGMGKQLPAQIPQNLSEHGKDFLENVSDCRSMIQMDD